MTAKQSANGTGPAFDLDAAVAAAASEAEGVPFAFTWKGDQYEVPPATSWPVAALRDLSAGELDTALATLLGQESFDRLCASGLTIGDMNVLFDQISRAAGVGSLPNSSARARPGSTRTSKRR